MEMKIASHGMLSIAGTASLVLGSLMLFEGNSPELQVSVQVLITTVFIVSAFLFCGRSGFKSQVSKPKQV